MLAVLRWVAAGLQVLAVLVVHFGFGWPLPVAAMLAVPALLLLWNLGTFWRLRRQRLATPAAVLLHLCVDVIALTVLLWLSGGPGNPFVSLYLLPIAVAAAALPAFYACTLAGFCTLAYSLMLWAHLGPVGLPGGDFFHWHVVGMWANFLVGALLLTVSLSLVAGVLRRRDAALSQAREQALRDERFVATGTLAAGTAHELNTPLSTMAVLAGELRDAPNLSAQAPADFDLLADQIDVRKQRLHVLLATADPQRHGPPRAIGLRIFLDDLLAGWRLVRPDVEARVAIRADDELAIVPEPTLGQALANLLNNAADASAANGEDRIDVTCGWADQMLGIIIEDRGPGLSQGQIDAAGRGFFSSKEDGFGLGLVLSNASIARLGGEVRLLPRRPQGLRTEVSLPLGALRPGSG